MGTQPFPWHLRGSSRLTLRSPEAITAFFLAWTAANDDGVVPPAGRTNAADALAEELAMRRGARAAEWAVDAVAECVRGGLVELIDGGRSLRMIDWPTDPQPAPTLAAAAPSLAAIVPAPQQVQVFSVYFIQAGDGGPIKIGCSCNVPMRLSVLQIGNAEPLRTLCTMPGAYAEEHRLHDRFKADNIAGEWFRPSADLMSFIGAIGGAQ